MARELWRSIAEVISGVLGEPTGELVPRQVGGGCINQAYLATASQAGQTYFVKLNVARCLAMFEAEADALREIAATETIRVPQPICSGVAGPSAYLVLEALTLQSRGDSRAMGQQLAALHRVTSTDGRFGWHRDNVIGETPQPNAWEADWQSLWRKHRLEFQVELARRNGLGVDGVERLVDVSPRLFEGYRPVPSLVHGDLWGGNASFDKHGNPVVFDPATYYGDREVDLAFTRMFGGFSSDFYAGYADAWPLAEGFERRQKWYNLYHELNHHNLFSGGYGIQAQATVEALLKQIG